MTAAHRKWFRERLNKFKALGLTTRGRPYRRRPNLTPSERPLVQRQRWLEKWRRRRDRFAALGLNSRGRVYTRADFTAAKRLHLLLAGNRLVPQLKKP